MLQRYVEDLLGRFGRDRRIIAWDLYNEPQTKHSSVALLGDVFSWARRRSVAASHRVLERDALLRHHVDPLLRQPTREPDEAQHVIGSAKSLGRPVVATEALGRPNHGELAKILPLFSENGIGWYLWELMIGADQTRYQWPSSPRAADDIVFQGLLYPDGTPYRRGEVELIRALPSPRKVKSRVSARADRR